MSILSSRDAARIRIILSSVFLGATLSVCISAVRISWQPSVFRSLAKIVAGGSLNANDLPPAYFGTIIETLESAELNRKSQERVHALHPEPKGSPVDIRVVRSTGSAVFNILATGSEPKYTQIFLNAVLDEFMIFRQSIREKANKDDLDVTVIERATTASEHTPGWKMPIILGGVSGAIFGVVIGALGSLFFTLLGQPKAPQA